MDEPTATISQLICKVEIPDLIADLTATPLLKAKHQEKVSNCQKLQHHLEKIQNAAVSVKGDGESHHHVGEAIWQRGPDGSSVSYRVTNNLNELETSNLFKKRVR